MQPICDELLQMLKSLRELAEAEGRPDQAAFFERIRSGFANAREFDDLAGPLMDHPTSAFQGFEFSLPVSLLLDRVLELAQTLSRPFRRTPTRRIEAHGNKPPPYPEVTVANR
jgi:hypothetical protein